MIELERYELKEGPAYRLRHGSARFSEGARRRLGRVPAGGSERDGGRSPERCRRGMNDMPPEIAAWLHLGPDGTISVYTGKTEVGQNIRTSP